MSDSTFRTAVLAATLAFREGTVPRLFRRVARRVGHKVLERLDARRERVDARDHGPPTGDAP